MPVVIFMLPEQETLLRSAKQWLVDGTFKAAPAGFSQMVNIMAIIEENDEEEYVQVCHVLINGRSTETYKMMWKCITNVVGTAVNVEEINIDFEQSMYSAIHATAQKVWMRSVKVTGCLFHFSQALYRFLRANYAKNRDALRLFCILIWVPYIPADRLHVFLRNLNLVNHGLSKFLDYFQSQWMSRISWWHVAANPHSAVVTNCAIESWHGKINKKITTAHPSIDELSLVLAEMAGDKINAIRNRQEHGEIKKRVMRRAQQFEYIKESIYGTMTNFIARFPAHEVQSVPKLKIYGPDEVKYEEGNEQDEQDMGRVNEKKVILTMQSIGQVNEEEAWEELSDELITYK